MAAPKKNSFAGLGASIITDNQAPASTGDGKPYTVTLHVEPHLVLPFERNLFWQGRSATRKSIINEALAFYFENHPQALANSRKAAPDENR